MIINRIIIENLGPFLNENVIVFAPCQNKHITLIGGKNGAGKTTLFNSIKIALYGCKNFGYEVNSNQYYAKIKNLINDKIAVRRNCSASISLDIQLNENNHFGNYTIKREWTISDGQITENYFVFKDNKELSVEDINDFDNYLLDLIPPSLFNFYFFDGEKIKEQLSDGQTNKFKDAFVKICGLDNLDILINCFKESYEEKSKDTKLSINYFSAKKEYLNALDEYNKKSTLVNELDSKIDSLMNEMKKNRISYIKKSGGTLEEWKSINQKIAEEETKREISRRELKDFANNGLPFIILKSQLNNLFKKLKSECNDSIYKNGIKMLEDEKIKKQIAFYLRNKSDYKNLLDKIKSNILSGFDKNNIYYDLSFNEINRILGVIEEKLKIDKNIYIKMENEIRESQNINKYLNKKINAIDISSYKEFSKKDIEYGSSIENLLNAKKKEIEILQELESILNKKTEIYEKTKKEYELVLKKESLTNISSRAYLSLKEYSLKLYSSYVKKFVKNFVFIFNSLINKKNLIDGIYVSEDISIYPYRITKVKKSDIKKRINKIGEAKFIAEVGEYGYLQYKKAKSEEFDIFVKINGTLSEGETQIYLMSVYFALMSLSSKDIPFIIDTPFARIDSDHRSNLLNKFFLKLNGQLMILSTDKEIDNSCIDVINKYINNVYLFVNKGEGMTKIFKNSYFEGCKL